MSFQISLPEIQAIAQELGDVYDKRPTNYPEQTITANSGRVYKVVNVIEVGDELIPSPLVTKGMYCCKECGTEVEPKYFGGSNWTRFMHNENKVSLYISTIHYLRNHPEACEKIDLGYENIKNVFLA